MTAPRHLYVSGLLWITACGGLSPTKAPPGQAPNEEDSATGGFVLPAPLPPEWDSAEVQRRLDLALPHLPDALTAQKEFVAALQHGDPTCPTLYEGWSMFVVHSGCTASTGWFYAGLGSWFPLDGDGDTHLGADFLIMSPEGERFFGAGMARYYDRDPQHWEQDLQGEWGWPQAEDWLADQASLLVKIQRDGNILRLTGGWSGPYGAFYFRNFEVDVTRCSGPTGTIEVRDDRGFWYALDWSTAPCAQLSYEGDPMGESCADPGPAFCAYAQKVADAAAEPPL